MVMATCRILHLVSKSFAAPLYSAKIRPDTIMEGFDVGPEVKCLKDKNHVYIETQRQPHVASQPMENNHTAQEAA